jgi:hypothetical protein
MLETNINKVSLQVFHCFSFEIQFQIFLDFKFCYTHKCKRNQHMYAFKTCNEDRDIMNFLYKEYIPTNVAQF